MPLATILVVCALLTPPSGGVSAAGQAPQEQAPDSQPAQTSPQAEPEKAPPPASTVPPPAQENPASPSPADTTQTTPQPEPESKPANTPPPAQETMPAENPKPAAVKPHANTAHRHTKRKPAHPQAKSGNKPKPAASSAQGAAPPKKIVRNGGTGEPAAQISPSLTQQQSSSQRKNIDQLLAATDANLKKLSGRQLTSSQTDISNQIRQYMEQSKTAADAGDMDRARNLATKARLLSEELAKH